MNRPGNILIITDGHPCRNPRPVKEASALAAAGFSVTLLYIRNHSPSVPVDAELLADAPFQTRSLDFLARDFPGRFRSFRARLASFLARKTIRFGFESPAALGPARPLLNTASHIPADLTLVHNALPHWVGLQLQRLGRRIAADIEDWNSEDLLPGARSHLPLHLMRRCEHDLLSNMVFTTTTSNALADALHARHRGKRPHVITNSFPLQPANTHLLGNPVPAFVWFSQTVGPGRGLEEFLAAWQHTTKPSHVTIIGHPTSGYSEYLKNSVSASRRDALEFLPPIAPGKLPGLLMQYNLGLALEPINPPNKNLTISNKILQYLNAGLAIVASNTAGQREVLANEPSAGIIVETQETTAFARSLDLLLADHTALAARQAAARRLAEKKYCWEFEAPRLIEFVEAALAEPLRTAFTLPCN